MNPKIAILQQLSLLHGDETYSFDTLETMLACAGVKGDRLIQKSLRKLEDQGLVVSEADDVTEDRLYSITPAGRLTLNSKGL